MEIPCGGSYRIVCRSRYRAAIPEEALVVPRNHKQTGVMQELSAITLSKSHTSVKTGQISGEANRFLNEIQPRRKISPGSRVDGRLKMITELKTRRNHEQVSFTLCYLNDVSSASAQIRLFYLPGPIFYLLVPSADLELCLEGC
jgi:hypothetical protein